MFSRRAENHSIGVGKSSNRCLSFKGRPSGLCFRKGASSAVMAELLGLAGHHDEGGGSESSELQYQIS